MKDPDNGIYTITYPGYYEDPTSHQRDQKLDLHLESPDENPSTYEVEAGGAMDSQKWGLLINVLLGATVVTLLAIIEFGVIPNIPAGFYCNDPSISHKFNGDTIGIKTLLLTTFFAPLIALWVVEACNVSYDGYTLSQANTRRTLASARLMWHWYREYLVGLVAVLLITEVAKLLVGEPRPHFLDTCQPDVASNCSTGGYMQTFTCTSTSSSTLRIKDSTKSFPSGHTSLSVYSCIFMIWFVQCRVSPNIAYLLVPCLQCVCLVWAMACSFTRITDHRHHWWDVLAGFVLGVIMAIYTVTSYCSNFQLALHKDEGRIVNRVTLSKENGQGAINSNRHQSVRRLLSSTSSYAGSISQEEKELREVPMA